MILITTAGKVGTEATRLLAERDIPVRVLVRNHEKASALTAVGADVVIGDLDDRTTVDAAMDGVTEIILVTAPVVAQELNVIESAVRARVQHVVKITSKASADSPILRRRWQTEIEEALSASGLPHTLLRNNAYMQNFLMLAPAIAKTGSFASSTGAGQVGFIDARDVAAVAAEIAGSPTAHVGKTYSPTGPQLLTYSDVAATLSKVLDRPITFSTRTVEEDKQAMMNVGVPEAIAAQNASAFALIADGDAAWITDDVPAILGHPARSLEQFANDYADAFG
jgi:uncharacterized protein YbjT (DUF2867 family)